MKKILIALTVLLSAETFAQQTINGVTLPANLKVEKTELKFNGGGIRKKAFFKVYVAGLYASEKTKDAAKLLSSNQEIAVRLQITSSVVSSSNMSESIREGFEKSTKGNTAPLKAKIDAFINTFSKEEIKEGDVFILYYSPEDGVKAYKNGKFQSTTAGVDFKNALFGIWLGPDPIDADLKKGLMGN